MSESSMTFGMIVGNRGFFPDHLAVSGRAEMIAVLEKAGHKVIAPTPEDTKYGAVESRADAKKCAELFRANRDSIAGASTHGLRPAGAGGRAGALGQSPGVRVLSDRGQAEAAGRRDGLPQARVRVSTSILIR